MLANASSFQWPWAEWEIVDAVPPFNAITIGEFEFEGILAVLAARVRAVFSLAPTQNRVYCAASPFLANRAFWAINEALPPLE
jgi:hypothetical protein